MNKIAAILMIVASTVLMQWHSIEFWTKYTGESGWAWSIGLEAAMLWLWYARRSFIIKILAAGLLIAGPWYQITGPAFESIQNYETLQNQIETISATIEDKTRTLKVFESNSQKRSGWAKLIVLKSEDIESDRVRLRDIEKQKAGLGISTIDYSITIMQALSLIVILTAQLMAVSSLPHKDSKGIIYGRKEVNVDTKILDKTQGLDSDIANEVRAKIESLSSQFKSRAALCRHYNFREADVSFLMNGKPVSQAALNRMKESLNSN